MNPDRSTTGPTVLSLLNIVQRGSTEQWQELYERCRDVRVARQLAAVLPLRDPDLMPSARLWRFLLQDLHPQLQIDLREDHRDSGV
jgi:hypothetical protein